MHDDQDHEVNVHCIAINARAAERNSDHNGEDVFKQDARKETKKR